MSHLQATSSDSDFGVYSTDPEFRHRLAMEENERMMDEMRAVACIHELTEKYPPSRLTLLTSGTRYRVTLGEIQRRIHGPECLNASFLSGILRKAKNKNVGKDLRETLQRHGLELQPGRRKTATPTCFTALVEDEARQMAKDFGDLIKTYYPQSDAATFLLKSVPEEYPPVFVRNELIAARCVIRRLLEFHMEEDSLMDYFNGTNERSSMSDFSDMTHKFGSTAFTFAMVAIDEILHRALQMNAPETEMNEQHENSNLRSSELEKTRSSSPQHPDEISLNDPSTKTSGPKTKRAEKDRQSRPQPTVFSRSRPLPRQSSSAQEFPAFAHPRTLHRSPFGDSRQANGFPQCQPNDRSEFLAHVSSKHGSSGRTQKKNVPSTAGRESSSSMRCSSSQIPLQRKRTLSDSLHPLMFPVSFPLDSESPTAAQLVVHQHLHRGRDGFRYIKDPYITTPDTVTRSAPSSINPSPPSSASIIYLDDSPQKEDSSSQKKTEFWGPLDPFGEEELEGPSEPPEKREKFSELRRLLEEDADDVSIPMEGKTSNMVSSECSPLQPVEPHEKTLNALKIAASDEVEELDRNLIFDPLVFTHELEDDRNDENNYTAYEQELIDKDDDGFMSRDTIEPDIVVLDNNMPMDLQSAGSETFFM